jgi:hypothetical protein
LFTCLCLYFKSYKPGKLGIFSIKSII